MLTDIASAQAMVANARWAERLGWDRYVDAIAVLVSSTSTEPGSRELANAIAGFQEANALDVDGILGPDTWDAMRPKLAPPDSLTGIVPPDAPPVPTSFDEVIALYGDPRPLLESDGSITAENESLWQRQTLAKGTLP